MRRIYRHIARTMPTLLLLMLCTLARSQGGAQVPWPDVPLDKRDYQHNIPATDRFWYYEPTQVHPPVEFPADPPVMHVLYMQGEDIVVKVRWTNWNNFALRGTLTWQAARLEVPGPNYTDPGPH